MKVVTLEPKPRPATLIQEEPKLYDFCEAQSDKLFFGKLKPNRTYELKGATDE